MAKVVLLHNFPEYVAECCELLNEEWPRSDTLRLESLKKSCDALPCSIVLIDEEKDEEGQDKKVVDGSRRVLVGHSRLARVLGRPNACWIESVIIRKDRRGQGLGKILMTKTEEYAIKLGFAEAHLSTHDKVQFYAKLSYERSMHPVCVSSASSSLMSNRFFNKLQSYCEMDSIRKETNQKLKTEEDKETGNRLRGQPPPPPPPLPSLDSTEKMMSNQTWMLKYLM